MAQSFQKLVTWTLQSTNEQQIANHEAKKSVNNKTGIISQVVKSPRLPTPASQALLFTPKSNVCHHNA